MKFTFVHTNFNVFDLEKSLCFYQKALGLHEMRRHTQKDGEFIIVFMSDEEEKFQLELTWLRDRKEPYDLGDQEFHICYTTDDYEAALTRHQAMGCVAFINEAMGLYFITDPDGYWIEIIPDRHA